MYQVIYCQELLAAYSLVVAGLTKERGLTMYEMYLTLRFTELILLHLTIHPPSQLGREEGELGLLQEAEPCLRSNSGRAQCPMGNAHGTGIVFGSWVCSD